jgi:hypothetical protein
MARNQNNLLYLQKSKTKSVQMTHQNYFDSDESTIGMVFSWIAAVFLNILQWLDMETISSILVFLTTIMAGIFTALKMRGQKLQNKNIELDNAMKQIKLNDELKRLKTKKDENN